jgi:hypothetical protein
MDVWGTRPLLLRRQERLPIFRCAAAPITDKTADAVVVRWSQSVAPDKGDLCLVRFSFLLCAHPRSGRVGDNQTNQAEKATAPSAECRAECRAA